MINVLKIKSLMIEKGFTQETISKQLGMSRQNFSSIIRKGDTSISILDKIAHVLDVEPQILLK